MLKLIKLNDALYGGLVYFAGDSVATLMTGEVYYPRMLGMLLLGSTLYAIEIPAYFRWLDSYFKQPGYLNAFQRMIMSAAFFNPLWIARHIVFINLFSGHWDSISLNVVIVAATSFLYCLPVALPVNYMIQNSIGLSWRYFASSVFSAFMAVYFAMSEILFG